ncbi:MAG: wcaG, partial [Prosthecobacter sp.]|nr:wcaG [Prosthecobacter sp.]
MTQENLITVAGAGGFIGGALVADLIRKGHTRIRAIDIKPFTEWYQKFDEVENLQLDLAELANCHVAARGAHTI